MDSSYFQKKRKLEQKTGQKLQNDFSDYKSDDERYWMQLRDEKPMTNEEETWYTIIGVSAVCIGLFIGLIILGLMSSNEHKDKLQECQDLGGEYIIVERHSKTHLYGCVKK